MATSDALTLPRQQGFGATRRTDIWWLQPLGVFLGFSAFIVYSTWAAFQGVHSTAYWFNGGGANYLSPFYSPSLFTIKIAPGQVAPPSIFGAVPDWWPGFLPFSPSFLIMWVPAGFRFTCYYYRGQYYKAFWLDPVACTVGEPRKSYLGERFLPLILQNIHRYFFYLAFLYIFILGRDAIAAFFFTTNGVTHFGVGVGSLVLVLNVVLLASYTLGCHSFRHLIGGFLDSKTKVPACATGFNCVSCLNRSHGNWAWYSLFWVGFTDVYIRLCAMGIWHDYRLF